MLWEMENKTWLVEMELAACLVVVAIAAFALMLGDTVWRSVSGK
jgi:hypothetical protein